MSSPELRIRRRYPVRAGELYSAETLSSRRFLSALPFEKGRNWQLPSGKTAQQRARGGELGAAASPFTVFVLFQQVMRDRPWNRAALCRHAAAGRPPRLTSFVARKHAAAHHGGLRNYREAAALGWLQRRHRPPINSRVTRTTRSPRSASAVRRPRVVLPGQAQPGRIECVRLRRAR